MPFTRSLSILTLSAPLLSSRAFDPPVIPDKPRFSNNEQAVQSPDCDRGPLIDCPRGGARRQPLRPPRPLYIRSGAARPRGFGKTSIQPDVADVGDATVERKRANRSKALLSSYVFA